MSLTSSPAALKLICSNLSRFGVIDQRDILNPQLFLNIQQAVLPFNDTASAGNS